MVRQKDGNTERQKDRKTERQKDRKTERQKDKKTEITPQEEKYGVTLIETKSTYLHAFSL
jgi:hypothetical protein